MKKILLFASFLFSFFAISAQSNKYYAWVGVFDDLEVGKTFPVVDAGGNAVEGATAVVEADANDPDNKVLHVTTGQTAGFVKMDTPDKTHMTRMPTVISSCSSATIRPMRTRIPILQSLLPDSGKPLTIHRWQLSVTHSARR